MKDETTILQIPNELLAALEDLLIEAADAREAISQIALLAADPRVVLLTEPVRENTAETSH